jgi:hypothetical protein
MNALRSMLASKGGLGAVLRSPTPRASRAPPGGGRLQSEWVAGLRQIGWPTSVRIGGRLAPDSVAALFQITHPRCPSPPISWDEHARHRSRSMAAGRPKRRERHGLSRGAGLISCVHKKQKVSSCVVNAARGELRHLVGSRRSPRGGYSRPQPRGRAADKDPQD